MNRSARLSAVVFAALIFPPALAGPPWLVSDLEPNDTVDSAVNTGLVDSGAVVILGQNGFVTPCCNIIEPGLDPDLFSVTVSPQANGPVRLSARILSASPDLDAVLHLFTRCPSNPTLAVHLAWRDDPNPPDAQPVLNTFLLEPGNYFVGISSAEPFAIDPNEDLFPSFQLLPAGQSYQLEIQLSPPPPIDSASEPDDADPVLVPSVPFDVTDRFIGDGPSPWLDIDRYLLNLAAPGVVTVRAQPAALGELNLLAFVNIGSAGFEAVPEPRPDLRTLSARLAVFHPGPVEIVIKSTDLTVTEICTPQSTSIFVPGHDLTGFTGFYDLSIDLQPFADAAGPFEPNDSIHQSTPTGLAAPGSIVFDAAIGDGTFAQLRGDVDFYRFDLALDERLECELSPTGAPDALLPVAHLYDDLGRRLRSFYPNADGTVLVQFQRTCRDALAPPAVAREKYYLAVAGAGDRPPADPLVPNPFPGPAASPIALHDLDGGPGSTGPYRLQLDIRADPLPRCGLEPDDSADNAPLVLVDDGRYVCVRGAIGDGPCPSPGADVDLIAFRLDSAPAALDLRLNSTLCGSSEGKLARLFDAAGNQIAAAGVIPAGFLPPPLVDSVLQTLIEDTGDYFIGVSDPQNPGYDPLVACSGDGTVSSCCDASRYELHLRLSRTGPGADPAPAGGIPPSYGPTRLFAMIADPFADSVVELDPGSGDFIHALPLLDVRTLGARGLAFDGVDLFLLDGAGRFPSLLRVNAESGEILGRARTWFGSGLYGGIVAIGSRLYITDILEKAVFELPDGPTGPVTRLDVGATGLFAPFGPIAAAVQPGRLLVSDAAIPGIIHTMDAAAGTQLSISTLGTGCACQADLDHDGDIDDDDAQSMLNCAIRGTETIPFDCRNADLNCDGNIDPVDENLFHCLFSDLQPGSHVAGDSDCCPPDLPPVPVRITALAGAGGNTVFAADRDELLLRHYRGIRTELHAVPLDAALLHLAGLAGINLGDGNADGFVNLLDWGRFQACYRGDAALDLDLVCEIFDFDIDGRVDLLDFDALDAVIAGPEP